MSAPGRAPGRPKPARIPAVDRPAYPMGEGRKSRVGIFGGSFDPVHLAHVALARTALEQLALDELRWVPTPHSWQKSEVPAPAADREAMVRIAIDTEPRFVLDARELRRGGPGFTLETVREMQAEQPGGQWFLLIGQDQYQGLHTWHGWAELLGRVTLAVAQRPGVSADADPQVQTAAQHRVSLPLMAVSSTQVRSRATAGLSLDGLVDPGVARYIEEHRLYRR